MRRRGLSLLEALLAGVILTLAIVGMLSLVNEQPRALAISQDRQIAEMLLEELREAYGFMPLRSLRSLGLGPPPDGTDALFQTHMEDHPIVTFPDVDEEAPEGRKALGQRVVRMQVQRNVFLEEESIGDGLVRAVVTFRVGWTTPKGRERQVEAHQVLYGRGGS